MYSILRAIDMISRNISLKLIAVFFILSFFTHQFGKLAIVADYYANTSQYAKNCINKPMPKLHCNGKCQMMKKIQDEEKKEKEDAEKKNENKKDTPLYFEKDVVKANPLLDLKGKNKFQSFNSSKPIGRSCQIFHPPKV
jgi:hypothetical protein